MMERMEQNPSATFAEAELRSRDNAVFERLRRDRLIRRSSDPRGEGSFVDYQGRVLSVVTDLEGHLECIDDYDQEFEPVPFEHAMLDWRLDVPVFSRRVREVNALTGGEGWLNDRLYVLGDAAPDRIVALAFLSQAALGADVLKVLPSLTSEVYSEYRVVCPSFTAPPSQRRHLEGLGIRLSRLSQGDPFVVVTPPAVGREDGAAIDDATDFDHADDYRWVSLRGRYYPLPPTAAAVVEILHRAWLSGAPDLSWGRICARLGSSPHKMGDVFRGVDGWHDLIVSPKRGLYRLNL
jgi:hypothetical protein